MGRNRVEIFSKENGEYSNLSIYKQVKGLWYLQDT